MLHKDSFIIAPQTFLLIQQLQAIDGLKDFYLVGGTALALQLGHRKSIDIDLFTQNDFIEEEIADLLDTKFSFATTLNRKNAVLAVVNEIKTNF
jgi:Nucleotidyl transferase AbiEii toxin, Type IV TA system